jgi:sporadic carbohydrate cluster 2OG-Fe(II) oxygenase
MGAAADNPNMTAVASTQADLREFATRGYAVVPASDPAALDALRADVFAHARTLVPHRGEAVDAFLDRFHDYGLGGTELNAFRIALVEAMTAKLDVARRLFAAFRGSLAELVGPDVAAQKTVNLVVQQPGDSDQVPIHRDAPSNSHFEVILWVPLVDVYGTKTMFIVDRADSARGLAILKDGASYEAFSAVMREQGIDVVVPYGSALLFAAGLVHGCKVNVESETRWSLNLRYKNLFSPYGAKGLAEFFDVLAISPLSRVAFAFERQEFGLDP